MDVSRELSYRLSEITGFPKQRGISFSHAPLYTLMELWEFVLNHPDEWIFTIRIINHKTFLYFQPDHGTDNSYNFVDYSLADAVAKMIIAFHEEKELEENN